MNKRVVILTGCELRHMFVRKAIALSEGVSVERSFCENTRKWTDSFIDNDSADGKVQTMHLERRERSEQDFFGAFAHLSPDLSNPSHIEYGELNDASIYEQIVSINPDLIIAYGCSLVRDPLLSAFEGKILNAHLGLSPYYRGSGTNFWPLVNLEPEYVGVSFMYMDSGVDTGEVIHQIRPRVYSTDDPHQIGNRLILDLAFCYAKIIRQLDSLPHIDQLSPSPLDKVYKKRDFSAESVASLYEAFAMGLIKTYLQEKERRISGVPIMENSILTIPH